MRTRWLAGLGMAAAILAVAHAAAAPIGEGITRKEMAEILQAKGLGAKIENDNLGNAIVSTAADGVDFDVYFFGCDKKTARCDAIQFAAGWTMIKPPKAAMLNAWNRDKRYVRAYLTKDNKALYGEMDLTVAPGGSTEQIGDYLRLWRLLLPELKKRFNLGK